MHPNNFYQPPLPNPDLLQQSTQFMPQNLGDGQNQVANLGYRDSEQSDFNFAAALPFHDRDSEYDYGPQQPTPALGQVHAFQPPPVPQTHLKQIVSCYCFFNLAS